MCDNDMEFLSVFLAGSDNYQQLLKFNKKYQNLPNTKLPETNPNTNLTITGIIQFMVRGLELELGYVLKFGLGFL